MRVFLQVGWWCVDVHMRREGSEVALGYGQVIRPCQMSAHSSYQVSCLLDTCLCENVSPEQIWCDSEHKGFVLNRNHPEMAARVGGEWALSPQGWPDGVRGGSKVSWGHWSLNSYVISQTKKSGLWLNIPLYSACALQGLMSHWSY